MERRECESIDGACICCEVTAGALVLRGIGLGFGVGKRDTEGWRGLADLDGATMGIDLTAVGGLQWPGDSFLLASFVRELATLGSLSKVPGRVKMLVLCVCNGVGRSSITSDFVNWRHNESISRVDFEGELGKAPRVRIHSTGGSPVDGRSGGGYVVGNAWGGEETKERGLGFW